MVLVGLGLLGYIVKEAPSPAWEPSLMRISKAEQPSSHTHLRASSTVPILLVLVHLSMAPTTQHVESKECGLPDCTQPSSLKFLPPSGSSVRPHSLDSSLSSFGYCSAEHLKDHKAELDISYGKVAWIESFLSELFLLVSEFLCGTKVIEAKKMDGKWNLLLESRPPNDPTFASDIDVEAQRAHLVFEFCTSAISLLSPVLVYLFRGLPFKLEEVNVHIREDARSLLVIDADGDVSPMAKLHTMILITPTKDLIKYPPSRHGVLFNPTAWQYLEKPSAIDYNTYLAKWGGGGEPAVEEFGTCFRNIHEPRLDSTFLPKSANFILELGAMCAIISAAQKAVKNDSTWDDRVKDGILADLKGEIERFDKDWKKVSKGGYFMDMDESEEKRLDDFVMAWKGNLLGLIHDTVGSNWL